MIPALIGFAAGWFLRGLWDRRQENRPDAGWESPSASELDVPPAAAFARGPATPTGDE